MNGGANAEHNGFTEYRDALRGSKRAVRRWLGRSLGSSLGSWLGSWLGGSINPLLGGHRVSTV
jgi:hypothetical protein